MATKRDLIDKLVKRLEYLNEHDAAIAVNCILSYLSEELSKGNRIEVRGFGSLSIRQRKYSDRDEKYNTVYYRMSRHIQDKLN